MVEALLGGGSARTACPRPRRRRPRRATRSSRSSSCGCSSTRASSSGANGRWRATGPLSELHVPPTIQALLAARLDPLAGGERSVIEPASVVGYVFADAAVSALTPPEVSPRVRTRARPRWPRSISSATSRTVTRASPLPAHHDPGHRVRRHPQAGTRRPPRAFVVLGRRGQPRPRRRVRGDPRLPPRAGMEVPLRARPARRSRPRDRSGRRAPARLGGTARLRPRRRSGRRDAPRPRRRAPARRPPGAAAPAARARRGAAA